jgi:hypothetical protein
VTDRTKAFLEGSVARQVAILTLQRDSDQAIADQLGLSLGQVKSVKRKEEYWKVLKEETEHISETLRMRFRKRLEGAEHHAWEAFLYHLKDKKTLEAVRMFAEYIGLRAKDETGNDTPALTIVMPGAQVPEKDAGQAEVIEVKQDE